MLARWSGALVLSAWLSVWGCAQAQPSEMVNAAKTGDVAAQYELGKAYLYGQGVQKNADDGLRWLRLAAEHHHAPSLYLLGLIYVLGADGMKKDPEAGLAYIHQAANAGNLDAQNLLGTIYLKGEAVEKDAATVSHGWSAPRNRALQRHKIAWASSTAKASCWPRICRPRLAGI